MPHPPPLHAGLRFASALVIPFTFTFGLALAGLGLPSVHAEPERSPNAAPERSPNAAPERVPVELGAVSWLRDFDAGVEAARKRDQALLVLFQEVPG